jgi:hypothetical protein
MPAFAHYCPGFCHGHSNQSSCGFGGRLFGGWGGGFAWFVRSNACNSAPFSLAIRALAPALWLLADAGVNIATFHLGRALEGGDAICLVSIDGNLPDNVLHKVQTLPLVMQATTLAF